MEDGDGNLFKTKTALAKPEPFFCFSTVQLNIMMPQLSGAGSL
jgi:hypothetical protein